MNKKSEGPENGPLEYDSPMSMVMTYFFFDDFLLLDFFDEDLEPFFDAAILLTTFHAVRDLPVALTWHNAPDCSGKIAFMGKGEKRRDGHRRPAAFAVLYIQLLAIIIFAFVNMRSIQFIVKQLFIEMKTR